MSFIFEKVTVFLRNINPLANLDFLNNCGNGSFVNNFEDTMLDKRFVSEINVTVLVVDERNRVDRSTVMEECFDF